MARPQRHRPNRLQDDRHAPSSTGGREPPTPDHRGTCATPTEPPSPAKNTLTTARRHTTGYPGAEPARTSSAWTGYPQPASPYKQALGLALLALGYFVIAIGVEGLQPGQRVSMAWLVGLYVIHTLGELCLSPIGLSMVNKLAPVKFASLLMGVWFLSTASANKFAGTLSEFYPEPVVAIATVEAAQQSNQAVIKAKDADGKFTDAPGELIPSSWDKDKRSIGETRVIPLESLQLGLVTDEARKAEIRAAFEAQLVPNPKHFLGFEISNLYQFFMLFVYMAGAASVVLFVCCPLLLKLMHGVR